MTFFKYFAACGLDPFGDNMTVECFCSLAFQFQNYQEFCQIITYARFSISIVL